MNLNSSRFGEIEINDDSIITFPGGLPGLEEFERYAIIRCEPTEPIQWLQSVDDMDLALPVINPFIIHPGYEVEVEDSELEFIKSTNEEDLIVLNVMVLPDKLSDMTVNLLAPILINIKDMIGTQVMMDHKSFSIAYPAFEALAKFYEEESKEADDAGSVEKGQ
ncbi:MAG: flagellar assembly protein FliW [Clostridia bacterium]|nr:flagellar assembly protein FliW [Clostridia bacterium]